MASGRIHVEITGDSRRLRREFLRVHLLVERSFWRKWRLRWQLAALNRDLRRNPPRKGEL